MTVDIGDVVGEGFERTIARNGLLFAAAFYVLSVVGSLVSPGPAAGPGPGMPTDRGPMMQGSPPDPGLAPAVLAVVGLVVGLLSLVVTIGAVRTFVGEETETVPTEHFTRNLGWALLNTVVGGIVFGLVVGVGFLLLIVPGLFLLVSLFFWNYYVIVEDENFVDGFSRSWAATAGQRLQLFALGVVVVVVSLVVNVAFAIPAFVLPGIGALLVESIGSALANVFLLATAARTFVRLTDRGREEARPARSADATT